MTGNVARPLGQPYRYPAQTNVNSRMKMLTKKTKLKVGILLHCLSFIAIGLYATARYSQNSEIDHVKRSIHNLTERLVTIDGSAAKSNNETSRKDPVFATELDSIQRELDDARSLLARPKVLSDTAFASWALLSITGSIFMAIGVKRQKNTTLVGSRNAG